MFNSLFDELKKKLKYFKEITDFKSLTMQKTLKKENVYRLFKKQSVLRTQVSIYGGAFYEYTERLTIFAIAAPSTMFDWVIYRPPKILKF